MKISGKAIAVKRLLWTVPAIAAIITGVYGLVELATSGIVPTKFFILGVAVFVLYSSLLVFLLVKRFKRKNAGLIARIISVILSLVLILVTVFGLYIFQRSQDTLNKLSAGSGSAVTIDAGEPFNIFISGIDTYGDIETQSRSDVNIVATVNPVTRKVLLTTIPRDSYVRIALGGNNQYDKLTHAGNYGVESSMQTVANLLDVDIDAYIRINFTTFIESIDKIGTITVDNPVAFTIDGESFPVGTLELNGKRALLYSRERKDLEGGDVDRGKNQQRVIQGIINKITSIRTVGGYEALLELLGDSVQTNLSSATIRKLINAQLEDTSGWTTDSYSLTGKGQTGGLPSYAMPSAQLYMYVLDESSVNDARQAIRTLLTL